MLDALAGGAIGSVLVGLAWAGVRVWAIPGDVDRHDRELRFADETLALWVSDDYRRLRQELQGVTNDMAAKGLLYSGIHGLARSESKTQYLHRYRDQLHEAERALAELRAAEGRLHAWYRRRKHREPLELRTPDRIAPVLDDVRRPTMKGGSRVRVFDPTRFDIDELLRVVKQSPLEPAGPPVEPPKDGYGDYVEGDAE